MIIEPHYVNRVCGPHFHLCIGEKKGSLAEPTPEDLKARRRPSKAQIFRRIDKQGSPISWGLKMRNGADQPMITIFFANPFLSAEVKIAKEPNWERLAMWRDISKRYSIESQRNSIKAAAATQQVGTANAHDLPCAYN